MCMHEILTERYHSPDGILIIGSYEGKICLCDWENGTRHDKIVARLCQRLNAVAVEAKSEATQLALSQLDEYFSGKRHAFSIPILSIGTDFQCRVWEELRHIPYGTTISYGELARRLGNPKAVRAVAAANAANPISIFVPCHRVIGCDNKLAGYGGGLFAKQHMLKLEKNQQ